MRMMRNLTILLVVALVTTPVMAKKLYRWVDQDGNVHYSDQVPPDEIDKARDELNQKGRVVDSIDQAASAAEIEAMGATERQQQTSRERLLQEIAADKKIEKGYQGEHEIVRNRDRKLAGLDLSIRNATSFIAAQSDSMHSLETSKKKMEANGGQVSEAFQSMLDDLDRQVKQQQIVLDAKTRERDEIVSFYDSELATYRAMLARKAQREAGS